MFQAAARLQRNSGHSRIKDGSVKHDLSGFASGIGAVAVSPDGKWLASGSRNSRLQIWDAASGYLSRTLHTESNRIYCLAFSPNGRWLASGGQDYSGSGETPVEIWDVLSGIRLLRLSHQTSKVEYLAFSPSGRWLASGGDDARLKIWDVSAGRELITLSPAVRVVSFSPDETWVATGSRDGALSYWDLPTGRLRERLPGIGWAYTVSADGRWLASVGGGHDFKIWNLNKVKQRVKSYSNPGTIFVLDLTPGRLQRTCRGHKDFVTDVAFSPDSRLVASASWDGQIKLWRAEDGHELRSLVGHSSGVQSVLFTSDGRKLLSGSWDGTLRIWDIETGTEIASLISAQHSGDWLALTPDGLFDGTPYAMSEVAWRVGNGSTIAPLERFFSDFFYPGLLADVFAGLRPRAEVDIATVLQVPSLHLMLAQKRAHVEARGKRLLVCFEQRPDVAVGAAVGDPDVPFEGNGFRVVSSDQTCPYRMELSYSGDLAALVAKLRQWQPELLRTPWDGKPSSTLESTLHVLTIGVGKYGDGSGFETLPSATTSAKAVEDFFARRGTSSTLYRDVRVWPGLYDSKATSERIQDSLTGLARQTTEKDVVFLFLAGHGVVSRPEEMFYFEPFDGREDDPKIRGISTAVIAESLRQIPARRIVLVIDSCQSGGAIEALAKIAQAKARSVEVRLSSPGGRSLANAEEGVGVHIFASALPFSYAIQRLSGLSAFASELLEALQQKGQRISAEALAAYLRKHVPEHLEASPKYRQVPLIVSVGYDFDIAVNP
jgi:WD40 repeat protein